MQPGQAPSNSLMTDTQVATEYAQHICAYCCGAICMENEQIETDIALICQSIDAIDLDIEVSVNEIVYLLSDPAAMDWFIHHVNPQSRFFANYGEGVIFATRVKFWLEQGAIILPDDSLVDCVLRLSYRFEHNENAINEVRRLLF